MTATTINPWQNLTARAVTQHLVYFDGEARPDFKCRQVIKSLGSNAPDTALLRQITTEIHPRITDFRMTKETDVLVEVWLLNQYGEKSVPVFSGHLVGTQVSIDSRSGQESVDYRAEIRAERLGGYVTGMRMWDAKDGSVPSKNRSDDLSDVGVDYHGPIIFNPMLDNAIENNRSNLSITLSDSSEPAEFYFWIDPESVKTATARTYQSQEAESWTLKQAIESLLWILNDTETFLTNGLYGFLDDTVEVENTYIPAGSYIPEALTRLLRPYNYEWGILLSNDDGSVKRSIGIVKRGDGIKRRMYLQKPGETLNTFRSNMTNANLTFRTAETYNRIASYGNYERREITVELYKSWAEEEDDAERADLDKSIPNSLYYTEDYTNTWRLWTANEAGDWNSYRAESPSEPLDLSTIFTGYVTRRRVFEDSMTYRGDRRNGILLEYYDGAEWIRAPDEWGWIVRQDQMGIEFTGQTPPQELMNYGDDARLRVTASISGDQRINSISSKDTSAPIDGENTLYVDSENRYLDDQRQADGTFKSKYEDEDPAPEAFEYDDSTEISEFVDDITLIERVAVAGGDFQLHGINIEYNLGDVIHEIYGRNISLNLLASRMKEGRFPQVTQINLDLQNQRTTIRVEPLEPLGPS